MEEQVGALEAALANTTKMVAGISETSGRTRTPCAQWNVRELVQHTVGVMANFAGGAANTGPVGDPSQFDLGSDPAATCGAVADDCVTNWTARGELDSIVSLGENEFPGMVGLNINMLDAYVHGWDIGKATGQDVNLDADLCAALLGFSQQIIPESPREGDNFGAVVDTAANASAQDQLLAYLGRQP